MAQRAQMSRKWFQSLSTPRRKTRIPQSRTGLEALEQRLLLTVDAFIDAEQILQISGSGDDDRIVATVDGVLQEITIGESDDDGSNLARFSLKDFRRIELDAADGNDFVNIIDADGTLDHREVVLQLSGGEGDNIVFLSTSPVDEINIKRFQQLSEASVELGDIARQIAATTQGGLLEESKHVIANASTRIVDLSAVLSAQAQDELITPGGELLDESQSELLTTAQVLLTEIQDIGARASRLENEMDAQVETQQHTEKRLTSSATQDDVGATGEQLEELSEALAAQGEVFAARGESIGDDGQVTGDGLNLLEETGQQILDGSARDLELAAESLAARAEQLEQAGAQLNADAEIRLASVGQNVLRIAERLEGVNRLLEAAFGSFTRDLTEAAERMTPAKADHGMCDVTPTHTFNGGSGFDFFFPLSAPTSSWLINGGAGTDVLFGGFAADAINGGDGTDFIFGLRGDDVIHGDDGIDFLFGEFLVDLPGITGNDCVFGDADIDLVVGDNGFEIGFSNPGGDDHLHGGSEIDIVIGDDISDIFDPAHAGGSDVMYGDEGIDALFGTGGDDTMEGGEQIDVMMGGGDNDTMYGIDNTFTGDGWTIPGTTIVIGNLQFGNLGNDTIYGGDGIDVQFGNDNDDKMYGKDYIDIMFGNADEDTMYGESGGEIFDIYGVPVRLGNLMFGGPANDEMWGGGDLDVMFGNGENDTMHGYDGNFELFGIDADVMFGNDGNDIMDGDAEELILFTSSDVMFGGDGADTMDGGKQSDLMFGGNGEDTMRGDSNSILLVASTDLMFGGNDNDRMDGGNSTDIMFGEDGDDNMLGDDESALLLSPDVMFGGNGNDSMNGGANSDLMFGNAGDDNMLGDSNVVWFVASTDVMFGNSGNDFMDGGNNTDLMFGNSGSDNMHGDNNSFGLLSADIMFGGSENDEMNGGNSSDGMFGGSGNDTMLGDSNLWWQLLSTDLMFGNSGCDQMFGGSSNDLMFGNSGVDMMNGQGLLDIMYGNSETDVMSGGNGSDLMFGNGGPDQISGNNGWDLIFGNSGDDRIFGDNGWDMLYGNSGNDQVQGGNGWDLIFGNSDNDCLAGNNGWDMIFGNSGDDCIAGGNGWDLLFGNSGNDHLLGDNGNDMLYGNSGNDNLEGGNGWDVIFGNSGNDNLWGGAGVDMLYGNSGNDNLWGGSGWPDLLFGGWGSDNTTQGGPNSSGITCVCVLAPLEPCVKFDFGDAPDSYGTTLTTGARHVIAGPRLGNRVDWELNGQPSASANGDDLAVTDDEDGVTISTLFAGATTSVPVNLQNAGNAFLNVWVDTDTTPDFSGSGEHVVVDFPLISGGNLVDITLPATALIGASFARFRVSTTGGLNETGVANDGEVEDYQIKIVGLDFGDAPASYGTLLANNGARHTLGGPFLGTLIDAEADGQPSVNADGDDMGGIDDEDGVVLSGMVAGTVGTAFVTLGSPGSAYLDAWVDFNADGDFFDPGEQILTSNPITGSMSLPFTVPVNATTGATYSRFRVSTMGGLAPIGAAQNGEVEDHRGYIKPAPKMDFGDAPDSYQTLRSNDGPRHIVGGPVLGTLIDAEADGQPSFGAFLDNATGLFDEEGVALSGMVAGGTATANVFLSSALSAYLDAWVDFGQDGSFDPTDQIFSSQPILSGANSLNFPVPSSALPGGTYTRFRVSTTGGLAPTTPEIGPAPFGEVEDHRASIEPPTHTLDYGDAPESLGYRTTLLNNGPRHTLGGPFLGTLIDAEADGQPSVNADGDDMGGIDDEDGVVLSAMVAGGTTTANVFLSNALSAYLDAWVDFNADGDFFDAGEQIFSSQPIATGLNPLNFTVPVGATTGSTYTRFRVSSWGGLAPTGLSQRGEVEDYRVDIESPSQELDYGDLPDDDVFNYPTLLANDGARHASGGPLLGSKFDTEADGQPSSDADADDINVSDDEDGINNGAYSLAFGGTVDVTIQTMGGASSAVLDAWIDFNQDGIFDNTSGSAEIIFNSQSIMNGTTTQTFSVPTGATLGNTYARFRVTDSGFPNPGQYGGPGEVEDYKIYVKQQIGDGGDVQFLFGGVNSASASQQEGTAAKDLRGNQTSTDSIKGQADLEAIPNNGGEKSQVELRSKATGDRVTAVGPTPAQFLEVYELDQRLELTLTENLFEDWGGLNEKWLHGEEGWYFITPDGNLYRWDGSSNATGDIVASLPVSFYSDPEQLCEARADSTTTVDDDIARFTAANLDYDLKLESDGNYSTNWGGEGEKWIRGTEGWYFITPTGSLYQWTRGAGVNGDLIAELDSRYHADPTLLTEALQSLSADEAAYAVDHGLNLYITPLDHFNWGGRNEKWIRGDSGWYFITEDGSVYSWDGKPTASGTLISKLSPKYYEDLGLLAATPSTGLPDVDNLLDDIFEDLGDLLQI